MKLSHRRAARRLLCQALYAWQHSGDSPARLYASLVTLEDTSKIDLAYVEENLAKIIDSTDSFAADIEQAAQRKMSDITPIEKAVLWVGCYELKFRLEIPYRVVINEAIEQAKDFGGQDGHKFVNTVLDKLAKVYRKEELK